MFNRSVVIAGLTALGVAVGTALPAAASVGTVPRSCAQPNGRVTSVVIDGSRTFIAGDFTSVRTPSGTSVNRQRLAAVHTATCELLSWNPSANASVEALQVVGTTVYAGGAFTSVSGAARNRLAAIDADTGQLLGFNPGMNKTVRTLAASADRLFAGGDFTAVGTATRKKLAAFSLPSGSLVSNWKPAASGAVTTLALSADASLVYVGGNFSSLAGSSNSPYLAAVRADDGSLEPGFRPRPGWPMIKVIADSQGVYGGGGGSGGHLGIWNLDGSLQRPIYQTDGGVQALVIDGGSLYAGGHFTNYCLGNTGSGSPFICTDPLPRRKLFEVSLSTGALTSWAPVLNSAHGVFSLQVDPGSGALWVGGDFTKVGSKSVSKLAVFP